MLPDDPAATTPVQARRLFADGLSVPTAGWCRGYAQANVLAIPAASAFDFLLFAQRNPKPCPVLEVLEPGRHHGGILGDDADIRTAVPRYRVFREGRLVEETDDATGAWRDDLVTFLIGCSFTFEHALVDAGIPVRHVDAGRNVPMYRTRQRCHPAGALDGPLVVSMRPIPAARVVDAVRITSRYPAVHGAPVHVGDPTVLGIEDLTDPDFGDPPDLRDGDVPVFWACGVTPQAMVMESAPDLAISHAPGYMLITDGRDADYQVP